MNHHLERQLKQDAKAIQSKAAARLAAQGFNQLMVAELANHPQVQQRPKRQAWKFGLVAAICLSVLSLTFIQTPENTTITSSGVAQGITGLNLNQIPQSVEQRINQPLVQEQQAIIADLKALKEQLLSI